MYNVLPEKWTPVEKMFTLVAPGTEGDPRWEDSKLQGGSIDDVIGLLLAMKEKGPGDFTVEISCGAKKDAPPYTFLSVMVYNFDAYMQRGDYESISQ